MKPTLKSLQEQLFAFSGQLDTIKETVEKNKETTERLEQNWDKDRRDFREFESRLAHLEVEFKTLSETVSKIPNLTRDKLAEAAEPILTQAQNLQEVIIDKEMVAINKEETKRQRKPWWKFWSK